MAPLRRPRSHMLGQIVLVNAAVRIEDHRTLHHIFQLPHIARPMIPLQAIQSLLAEARHIAIVLGSVNPKKMLRQKRDILDAVAQGRDFDIDDVSADGKTTFTMHSVSPGFIIALYESLYGKPPPAYLLQIRGYEWEMEESLSPGAQKNLGKAWSALREIIRNPDLLTDENFRTAISTDNGLKA